VSKILYPAIILLAIGAVLVGFSAPLSSGGEEPQAQAGAAETSELRLGMDYYQKKDYKKALEYFHQAADQGDLPAFVQIGLMYDFGQGVPQNYSEARKWYLRAAEKGEPRAMYLMGHMYEFGEGVAIDSEVAFDWYMKSARQGHSSAQFVIGKILIRTNRDSETYLQGVKWLKMAARQCHAKALEVLQTVTDGNVIDMASCSGD
jgi:uncharacterized protein